MKSRLTHSSPRALLVASVSSLFLIANSNAGLVTLNKELTSNSPTFSRANNFFNSSFFYYFSYDFSVSQPGLYEFRQDSTSIDSFLYLYSSSFDPSFPSLNLIAQDDDSGAGVNSFFSRSLTAGISYTLVATTFAPNITGAFTLSISGPGDITESSAIAGVPEPSEFLLGGIPALLGAGALLRRRRARKQDPDSAGTENA
jgi:hypothetical protein